MMKKYTIEVLKEDMTRLVKKVKATTKWRKAVKEDALWLIEELEIWDEGVFPGSEKELEYYMLNGQGSWYEFSRNGNALCYNYDIAEHYCTIPQFKKYKEGMLPPSDTRDWCDVQGAALLQAARIVKDAYRMCISSYMADMIWKYCR